jgi:hypothetical protein
MCCLLAGLGQGGGLGFALQTQSTRPCGPCRSRHLPLLGKEGRAGCAGRSCLSAKSSCCLPTQPQLREGNLATG